MTKKILILLFSLPFIAGVKQHDEIANPSKKPIKAYCSSDIELENLRMEKRKSDRELAYSEEVWVESYFELKNKMK